jgi:hypothetical protein
MSLCSAMDSTMAASFWSAMRRMLCDARRHDHRMHLRAAGTHGAGLALTRRYETIRCAAKSGRAADLLLIELADTTLVRSSGPAGVLTPYIVLAAPRSE